MPFQDQKRFWNERAATPAPALLAADGSRDARAARPTGAFSAPQVRAAGQLQRLDSWHVD